MEKEANVKTKKEVKFIHCLIPVLALIAFMVYGLGIRPFVLGQDGFSIELILIGVITVTVILLFFLGFSWDEMLQGMIRKFSQGMGSYLIMLCVGVLIASWIISGTIPMLIYYGIKIINAKFIYLIAFIITCIFSILTGTSWGSAGTIGVVLIGVGTTVGANLPMLAGAIVSGAVFGDKMSPLSDTTNLAAMAAGIDVYEHIGSMLYSTVPAAVVSLIVYGIFGAVAPPSSLTFNTSVIDSSLLEISSVFNMNIFLIIPPIIILIGSFKKWPTVPVFISSALVAVILGAFFQNFTFGQIVECLTNGFSLNMVNGVNVGETQILSIFERGGLYSMVGTVLIGWLIFMFMGLAELINAMPTVVNRVFRFVKTRISLLFSTYFTGLITLLITGNGYAGTLISADVFKAKFDELKIPRRILSRACEDSTTMWDVMFAWGPSGRFMSSVLGIATGAYFPFVILTLANTVIAFIYIIFGIGGYKKPNGKVNDIAINTNAEESKAEA